MSAPRQAPPLELPDTAGESHALPAGPAEAAATVVVWTCNHCPYALAWHDRLVDVANDYADRGVRFLAVNSNDAERYPADGPDAMRERFERERWPFPYLHDESRRRRAPGTRARPRTCSCSTPSCGSSTRARPTPTIRTPACAPSGCARRSTRCSPARSRPPSTEPVGCSIKWKQ